VKFLSRFVKIETRSFTIEYGIIAGGMGLALLAVAPILAASLASALSR
jgi:Flp pilus assembly pilin Flp